MRRRETMKGRNHHESYRYPCLTMHQPWASLLVHGIKRIEGRSWPAPLTGRLWIHAASKIPDPVTVKVMEDFYKAIYAVNGIKDIKFPENYPVSRLLGCVEVVGCIKCEELVCWEDVPEAVRLEGLTNFCWLCEKPQLLLAPFEMRGNQGVYNLEMKIYEAAVRGLYAVEGPQPVQFPLPDPQNPFSLKPGSILPLSTGSKTSKVEKTPSLTAAIDAARTAATQFSKKVANNTFDYSVRRLSENKLTEDYRNSTKTLEWRPQEGSSLHTYRRQNTDLKLEGSSSSHNQAPRQDFNKRSGAPSNNYTENNRMSAVAVRRPQEKESLQRYKGENSNHINREDNSSTSTRATQQLSSRFVPNSIAEDNRRSTVAFQQRPQERELLKSSMVQSNLVDHECAKTTYNRAPARDLNHKLGISSNKFREDNGRSTVAVQSSLHERDTFQDYQEQSTHLLHEDNSSIFKQASHRDLNRRPGASSKIFQSAMKGLRQDG